MSEEQIQPKIQEKNISNIELVEKKKNLQEKEPKTTIQPEVESKEQIPIKENTSDKEKTNHRHTKEIKHQSKKEDSYSKQVTLLSLLKTTYRTIKTKESPQKLKKDAKSFFLDPFTLGFLVVIIFGINMRLRYFSLETLWNDAAVYMWMSEKILLTPAYFFTKEFLLDGSFTIQMLTAFFNIFGAEVFTAARLSALTFSILGIIFIYLLGKEIRGKTVGIVAAALLASSHLLWFYNTRILADAPLVTMVIIAAYFLTKLEKAKEIKWAIPAAIFLLLTVLTKRQAIIFPVGVFLFYLIKYKKEMFTNKALLACWGISWGLPVIGALGLWALTGQNYLYGLFVQKLLLHEGIGAATNVLPQIPFILSKYLLIAAIIGAILVAFYKIKNAHITIFIISLYAIWFEIGIELPLDRYLLPIIPLAAILGAITIDEIAKIAKTVSKSKVIYLIALVILAALIIQPMYTQGENLIESKSFTYTGYQEAGAWVNENLGENDILYAGSPRMMRAFTAREYSHTLEQEGRDPYTNSLIHFRTAQYKENQSFFEQEQEELSKTHDIFIEIDIWEYTQAPWYFPISYDSITYFESLGYEVVHIINKD